MKYHLSVVVLILLNTSVVADETAWLLSRAPSPAQRENLAVEPVQDVPLEDKAPAELSYEEAQELAIAKGLPLVVWIGGAVCPSCIGHNLDEFIHFFSDEHTGFPPDSLTVGVPSNGKLLMAGQVRADQQDGGWPDGHIPTVRRILQLWHAQPVQSRRTITSVSPPGSIWSEDGTPQTSMGAPAQPAMMFEPRRIIIRQPVRRFMMSGAACAT